MLNLKQSKDSIIRKAEDLGTEYEALYKGCSQCVFLAVLDALRWGGLELMPVDAEEKLYPAISVLTAGVCLTGEGTCGAITGGVMVLGLALGVSIHSPDMSAERHTSVTIRNSLLNQCIKRYNSILCKDIQRKIFGKAWDLTRDDMEQDFLGVTCGCIIMETARLATKCILDEYERVNANIIG